MLRAPLPNPPRKGEGASGWAAKIAEGKGGGMKAAKIAGRVAGERVVSLA